MAEKVIAHDINDASARIGELFREPDGVEESEHELKLKQKVAICIENPDISTNLHIAHNPLDVLLDALGVLSNVPLGGPLERVLGRPRRPINRNACLVPDPLGLTVDEDAGHFKVHYLVVPRKGLQWLDCYAFYDEGYVYDFLIHDFAMLSLCMQMVAANGKFGVGHMHIMVKEPKLRRDNLAHFDWTEDSLGLTPLVIEPLAHSPNFLSDLKELLTCDEPPIGLMTPFLRKVVAPAMMMMNAINKDDLAQADAASRQLPVGLDWTHAVLKFLESKGV